MFAPSREEVRTFFAQAWKKHRASEILTPIETIAADWVAEHPEYHALLEDGEVGNEYRPEDGKTNPFLHLSMHLSITEQVSIDQPPGIRAAVLKLTERLNSVHLAQHRVMECLGEMLWRSQRDASPPDGALYIDCVRRQANP